MRFAVTALALVSSAALAHPLDSPADALDEPLNRRAMNDIIANTTAATPGSLLGRAAAWLPSLGKGDTVIKRAEENALEARATKVRTKHPWIPVFANSVSTKAVPSTSVDDSGATSAAASPTTTATPTTTAAPTTSSSSSSTSSSTPAPTSSYTKVQDWTGTNFFNGFDWFTASDPTHGQVNFVNWDVAFANGLAGYSSSGSAIMRTDDTTWLAAGANRNSVRLTSKQAVDIGSLVLFDANKIPYGPTVWPAFWMVGQNWPSGGEIDIVEGVHNQVNNYMTLHTSPGCYLATPMQASGQVSTTTCDANVDSNVGCSVHDTTGISYGSGFNSVGGGVYATLFMPDAITMWFFQRSNIPSDISSDAPNPAGWGEPVARWDNSACDIPSYFGSQTIVFDITICGDWAGNTYNQAGFSGSCSDAVQNPNNYVNAVFDVNYVRVYKAP